MVKIGPPATSTSAWQYNRGRIQLADDARSKARILEAASCIPPDFTAMCLWAGHPIKAHVREHYKSWLDEKVPRIVDEHGEHPSSTAYNKGCRCWHCVEDNRIYQAAHKRGEAVLRDDRIMHARLIEVASRVPFDPAELARTAGHPVITQVREHYREMLNFAVPKPDDGWIHGKRSTFVAHRCRCWHCTEANRLYTQKLNRRLATGRTVEPPLVDARAAYEKVGKWRRAGIGRRTIERCTGVGRTCLRNLRRNGKTTREVAEKIERTHITLGDLGDAVLLDRGHADRLVEELLAMGMTKTAIGAFISENPDAKALQLSTGDRVTSKTMRRVVMLHHRMRQDPDLLVHCKCLLGNSFYDVCRECGAPPVWGSICSTCLEQVREAA